MAAAQVGIEAPTHDRTNRAVLYMLLFVFRTRPRNDCDILRDTPFIDVETDLDGRFDVSNGLIRWRRAA